MTAIRVQSTAVSGGFAASVDLPSISVTTGNTLLLSVGVQATSASIVIDDHGAGNIYALLGSVNDGSGYAVYLYHVEIANGGATQLTVSADHNVGDLTLDEWSGSADFVAIVADSSITPTGGTDGIVASNLPAIASGNTPGLLWSMAHSRVGVQPTAGTGFTAQNTGVAATLTQSERVTSAGTYHATATSARTDDVVVALTAYFTEGPAPWALRSSGAAVASFAAALTTAAPAALAATGAAVAAFGAAFRTGVFLAASAASVAGYTANLTAGPPVTALAANIQAVSSATAAFTNYATVTLTAPLYTGVGGILDPDFWLDSRPGVGTVIYYDPTFITISAHGEISSTSNDCSAVVEFFDGSSWAQGVVVLTPNMVSYCSGVALTSAALTTAPGWSIQLAATPSGQAFLQTTAALGGSIGAYSSITASLSVSGANPFAAAGAACVNSSAFLTTAPSALGGWTWDSLTVTFDSLFDTLDGASPWGTNDGLSVDTITSNGAIAHWTQAPNPVVTGYMLRLTPTPSGTPTLIDAGNAVMYVFAGLTPSSGYLVEIAAYDGSGHLTAYQPLTASFTTLASSTTPPPPTGVTRMQPQYVFGPGIGWITPLTDASGAAITNPAPCLIAAMQDISLDMSAEVKELYGSGSFAVAIGRGKMKMAGKVKNGQMHGALWNQLYFGQTLTQGVYSAYYDAIGTTLSTSSVTPTVPASGTWGYDLGVRDVNNIPLKRVVSAPAAGQYAVTNGVYTFSAADVSASKVVYISFNYTASSAVAQQLLMNNVPMGYAPTFQFDLMIPYQGNVFNATLFSCMATKASLQTKLDDFTYPEFDFSAFAPGASAIGRLTWSQ